VSVSGPEVRGRSRVLLAFRRPDALRIEIPGPAGARLVAVVRAGRLTAVLPAERAVPDAADPARRVEQPALEAGDVLARGAHTQPRSRQAWATRLMAIT
jgi:hypothetical protein